MAERLRGELSPYLLQHAENPVDWRPWGPDALEEARREDRPIFLSIGYSTCHWCHVMARESFQSEEVAAVLNRSFIPIKVDREERPDVDAVYMAACVALNGSGGWPLTLLLTPEQKPFWAGTYLPKRELLRLLKQAARRWQTGREALLSAGDSLTAHLRRSDVIRPGTPGRALVEEGVRQFARRFDRQWGGFGQAPKFPAAHDLLFLLRCAPVTGDGQAREMAELTLERMYRGGLFDHVGGGFSRYSTDRQWLVPHFEKMLYDNALLVLAYTESFQQTRRDWCRRVVRRTLDYVLGELAEPCGGFACGQDADSGGVEGKYYVFTPGEVVRLLGPKAGERFCRRFGITPEGNFEGKSIPNLLAAPDWEREPEELPALRQRLCAYRKERAGLHRDDKVLTAWNGLMLAALARAALVLDEPRWLEAAERTAAFLRRELKESGGRLLACWRQGRAAQPGRLEDYAFTCWGLLELYGAGFRPEHLEEACALADTMLSLFFDSERGGFYPYAVDGEQLITRSKESWDGAMPSGNAAAALVLSRLARLTGESRWREAAELQLRWLAGAAGRAQAGHSFTLLTLLEELWPTAELVCASAAPPEELREFLRGASRPGLTVLVKTPETAGRLAVLAPFTAGFPVPASGARYFLCRDRTCARPVDSINGLEALLETREKR